MVRPIGSSIAKVKYNLNFYPGYVATSPRILKSHPEPADTVGHKKYNKHDVSHLFMDEYGGFGVYLLDNEKELYNATGAYPNVTYRLTSGKIFWSAFFPPKNFSFGHNKARKAIAASSWYSYQRLNAICPPSDLRPVEVAWSRTHAKPDTTYWLVSNTKKLALKNYLLANYDQEFKDGYFVHFGDMALWQYWYYDYVPKQSLVDSDQDSLLRQILRNVRSAPSPAMKAMVYTSPQYFLQGSRYSSTNPFTAAGLVWNSLNYNYMATNIDQFTFDNGKIVTFPQGGSGRIPIMINFDMLFANPNGCRPVDAFMNATDYPKGTGIYPFPSGSREGKNIWDYLQAIGNLKNRVKNLDGIYMDTFYEFNIPRTYQLMRELRRRHGNNFVLFRHASAKEGQDAYLPQIDAYADFVLSGEGRENYGDRKLMRFFVSTYNISNSVGVLYPHAPLSVNLIDSLITLNLRAWYPTIRAADNPDQKLEATLQSVRSFWGSFGLLDSAAHKSRVEADLANHQPSYQTEYQTDEWWYAPSWGPRTQDTPLAGDFNADGKADIVMFKSDSSKWYAALSTGTSFGPNTWTVFEDWPPLDDAAHIALSGDFNGDGWDDLLAYRPGNFKWRFAFNKADDTGFKDSTNFDWGSSGDTPLVGDFNGDGKDDVLRYNSGEWVVKLSRGWGFHRPT